MTFLNRYLDKVKAVGNHELAECVLKTVKNANEKYIKNFNYSSHITALLVGHVQSGKTSQMFGIIANAADEGFSIFVILTTDNILLQQQTLSRVYNDLPGFCICGEDDYFKFQENKNLRDPTIIVLKKNSAVLKRWKNNFHSTNFCKGNPLFIIDDEADAASLNTLVNQNKTSPINKTLEAIINTSSSSIYLQVTGTPQSIFLQNSLSDWRPDHVYFFEPGVSYIGGNVLFSELPNKYVILTDDDEAVAVLDDDEYPENNLKIALIYHLISAAHIFIKQIDDVCNFIIHPSVKISEHKAFAEKIGDYLNELNLNVDDLITDTIQNIYNELKKYQPDLCTFEECITFIKDKLSNDQVNVLLLNSVSNFNQNSSFHSGINVIVGGNSLGRGVTFPKLQSVYYCRSSKTPQADTMWQHARMFGYDREREMMRVFMPRVIFKLFSDINQTNNYIISQISRYGSIDQVKIFYPKILKPTRKNVLDNKTLITIAGEVNYFPFEADNDNIQVLDNLLQPFNGEEYYQVSLKLISEILNHTSDVQKAWQKDSFVHFIGTYLAQHPNAQGILIVRRGRDISKGSGTLLSPDDRRLGASFKNQTVLTLYKVTGTKGWDGREVWIPNIKLPNNYVYYDIE